VDVVTQEFGQNAGKVWQALVEKGPLSESKLVNTTFLDEHQVFTAVGWLARENKICCNRTVYKIGDTNLVEKIGSDAGKIWSVLFKQQTEMNISSLARLAKMHINDAYAAVGWLARENKIKATILPKQKNQQLKIRLV
jgi:hypothetical protein